MSKTKKIFLAISFFLLILGSWQADLLAYAFLQAQGQLRIVWNTQKIETVIAQKSLPDSLLKKLDIVQKAKKYAIDSLGLSTSQSYQTVFDQKGKPVLWVVTASLPYELSAYQWDFPILGTFSYKGFFEEKKAQNLAKNLEKEGFDVRVGTVNAWSTLGWLPDPILSNTLYQQEGELAELVIHELTHGTLYIKDSVDFNENLATFVGVQGALRFLENEYGKNHQFYQKYLEIRHDDSLFTDFVLRAAQKLDSVYQKNAQVSEKIKKKNKEIFIKKISESLDTLQFYDTSYKSVFSKKMPNNAYFMGYKRYNSQQDFFKKEFENDFKSNFPLYFKHLKGKYKSL